MPLRDHFRSPLDDFTAWEGFHGGWPMVIVQALSRILPAQFVAAPRVHLGAPIEIDVATYDTDVAPTFRHTDGNGVAAAVWAPTAPTLTVPSDLADLDTYEVRVYDARRGRRLVAAVEIVSPANKDRPEHRSAFVAKCAALLEQRVSVCIIDLVTVRDFNLYADLLELLERSDPALGAEPPGLYAVACRLRQHADQGMLDAWNLPLELGQPLPTLPLWLTEELAVPLELEATYEQTCRDLRIP